MDINEKKHDPNTDLKKIYMTSIAKHIHTSLKCWPGLVSKITKKYQNKRFRRNIYITSPAIHRHMGLIIFCHSYSVGETKEMKNMEI